MGNTADVRANEKTPNLEDVLLIGGVKYDYKVDSTKHKNEYTYSVLESNELLGDTINRSISRNGFSYLPGTEKEIFKIDSLLVKSKQLSGYNATETAFKNLSGKSPSILHIATHGLTFHLRDVGYSRSWRTWLARAPPRPCAFPQWDSTRRSQRCWLWWRPSWWIQDEPQ